MKKGDLTEEQVNAMFQQQNYEPMANTPRTKPDGALESLRQHMIECGYIKKPSLPLKEAGLDSSKTSSTLL